jgi:hypothetical protein
VPQPATPIARELARGDWMIAVYGRGTFFGEGARLPPVPLSQLPDQARVAMQTMLLVDEIGFGVRGEGDTVHLLFSVRTALGNPDAVIEKLLAITPEEVFGGTASAKAKQIAASAPTSPFAADFKAGIGGMMIPTAVIGIIAAVAIPAYMQSAKKPRRIEADVQLERIGQGAKRYHEEHGAFPKGKVGPAPANRCCTYPGGRCNEPGAWKKPIWQQLDMKIEEPHLHRYAYESDGKTFNAKAISDLDCDGIEVEWVLHGAADANGNVVTTIIPPSTPD